MNNAISYFGLRLTIEEAKRFICANDTACYTDDSEYPITADMLDLITKDILQTELQALISTVQDLENNAEHNPIIRAN